MPKKIIIFLYSLATLVQIGIVGIAFYYVFDGTIIEQDGTKKFAGYSLDDNKNHLYLKFSWITLSLQAAIFITTTSISIFVTNIKSKYWQSNPKYVLFHSKKAMLINSSPVISMFAIALIFSILRPISSFVETKTSFHTFWYYKPVHWYYVGLSLLVLGFVMWISFIGLKIKFLVRYKTLPEPDLPRLYAKYNSQAKLTNSSVNTKPTNLSFQKYLTKLKIIYFLHLFLALSTTITIFYCLLAGIRLTYIEIAAIVLSIFASMFGFWALRVYAKQTNTKFFSPWNLPTRSARTKELWRLIKIYFKFSLPITNSLVVLSGLIFFLGEVELSSDNSKDITINMLPVSYFEEVYRICYYVFLSFVAVSLPYLIINGYYWVYSIYKNKSWLTSKKQLQIEEVSTKSTP